VSLHRTESTLEPTLGDTTCIFEAGDSPCRVEREHERFMFLLSRESETLTQCISQQRADQEFECALHRRGHLDNIVTAGASPQVEALTLINAVGPWTSYLIHTMHVLIVMATCPSSLLSTVASYFSFVLAPHSMIL
jgi:hypothetical protein